MLKELENNKEKNNNLDEPFVYVTTAELMMAFGKPIDEALDIHNELNETINMKNTKIKKKESKKNKSKALNKPVVRRMIANTLL